MYHARLVTFDVYMALLDIGGSLTPVVEEVLKLQPQVASAFVQMWRAKQMERAAISNSLDQGHVSFHDATGMGLDYVANLQDIELDTASRDALIAAWYRLDPWPEADAALAGVNAKGIPTAILSNGDMDMLEGAAARFNARFDYILSAEQAGKYKPHPAVYALPETILDIPSRNVVHVAGSANDVIGANAAGMTCIWSNRHGDRVLDPAYPAHMELSDLSRVPELVSPASG